MKKMLLILTAFVVCTAASVTAKIPGNKSDEGINFFNGTWKEAVAKAKEEHKPIFLDIYATWCGPCRMLTKYTFTDKELGDYFNAHFVNVEYDGEQPEGAMLANKFRIQAYPTLIIVTAEGKVLFYNMGYYSHKELLKMIKDLSGMQ